LPIDAYPCHMSATPAEQVLARVRIHQGLPTPAERRRLREAANLTKTEIAEAVGATRQAVTFWEAGTRTPRGKYLERYVEALTALKGIA